MNINFKCPKCNHDALEEVLVNVIMSTVISGIVKIENEVYTDTGPSSTEEGDLSHYQCVCCGEKLHTESGMTVSCEQELYEWLENNNMLLEGKYK
jgi:hypothetical protein